MNHKKKVILLQVITSSQVQTYEIDKSEFLLGRGDASEVRINENGISREHLKVRYDDNLIQIQDLNSSNGTFIEGHRIEALTYTPVFDSHTISFGNAQVKIKLKILEISEEIKDEVLQVEKQADEEPIIIDVSAFPKTDEDFKLSFKNVGINIPKYKNPSEHAKEIIDGAEYIKRSIIKSAEVYKTKMINETKLQTKKATDEAYQAYQAHIDRLLDETRQQLHHLKVETEILLDDKRLQANEEIQNLWKEHREIIAQDKRNQLETIEKENIIKLELSMEKLKSDMFSERHRLVTEAENEILRKKRTFQVEFENEKAEHLARLKLHTEELLKIQEQITECDKQYKENKTAQEDSTLDLSKIVSQLKQEKENLDFVTKNFQATLERHKQIETELAHFSESKTAWILEKQKNEKECEKLSHIFSELSEKKHKIDEEIKVLSETLSDTKKKLKDDIETEYHQLKEIEAKKFSDYKASELKELQKIRDVHTNTIKKFSVDLSQEIATKLEMLSKKSGFSNFQFEKHFELINSVIQIKSSMNTGSESIHAEQLEGWKNRKRKESFTLISTGFAAGLVFIFLGNLAYKKLNTDPVQERMAKLSQEQKLHDAENQFIPVKVNRYFETYVDSTLYTEKFTETYLNDKIQQEWVNYATKYFLKHWKVDEEKVIQVISNSKAFVQNVNEAQGTLKKNRLNADIAKLKAEEEENTQNQAKILGTNVKYEAYKKIEKDFFWQKIQRRAPARQ